MGILEQHLGNTTSTTILHQLRHLWKSPRGTVIRIEALALIAIVLSFLLAAFGACRRWSNRWIIQKGFLAANVLSLSLGTYSIGLMQSSAVKSDMYPFWGVSMLALFGCVDPITDFNSDSRSQLWKTIYQLCLYSGYVLLISTSTISSHVSKNAIVVLSVITFIKGFHRSLVFLRPNEYQRVTQKFAKYMFIVEDYALPNPEDLCGCCYVVGLSSKKKKSKPVPRSPEAPQTEDETPTSWEHLSDDITMDQEHYAPRQSLWSQHLEAMTIGEIWKCKDDNDVIACRDVCLSRSLSFLLQRRYFRFPCAEAGDQNTRDFIFEGLLRKKDSAVPDYERAFKVIEVEMAFLYDAFFTGNLTLHSQQAQASSVWQFTSVIGICFVGAAALNHGTSSGHISGGTIVVNTTTADLVITLVILASLVLLQVLQLMRCWTSNWARVKFVHDYIRKKEVGCISPGMRVRALLTRINGFDSYLWQNKLGQYSFVESVSMRKGKLIRRAVRHRLSLFFGFHHVYIVLRELFGRETGYTVKLHSDVKKAVAEFLCKIRTEADSSSTLDPSGSSEPSTSPRCWNDFSHTEKVLAWHIATCYCEMELGRTSICCFRVGQQDVMTEEERKDHGVATALQKYYAYLVVSAPQLLYSDPNEAKEDAETVAREARIILFRGKERSSIFRGIRAMIMSEYKFAIFMRWCQAKLIAMIKLVIKISFFNAWNRRQRLNAMKELGAVKSEDINGIFEAGVELGKRLVEMPERWKALADFWVQALLYAAPCGDAKEHIRHLAQGGEFITHLWALLNHAGIHDWERDAKTLWRHGDSFTRWPECTSTAPGFASASATGDEPDDDIV